MYNSNFNYQKQYNLPQYENSYASTSAYYQPMQMQTQQQITPNANVKWIQVNGIDGAKNHIVQPNCTAWLMDNNESKFYVKSADSLGVTTLKAYQFMEIPLDAPIRNENFENYATKEDLQKIKNDLDTIIENKINDLAKQSLERS